MMTPVEVTIEDRKYQVGPIPAMVQFHITRRLAPAFTSALPAVFELLREGDELQPAERKLRIETVIKSLPGVAETFASMPDADAEYVVNRCLDACSVQQEAGNWARIRKDGVLMFADLSMPVMLRLAWEALSANMGGFFPTELPKGYSAAAPASPSPISATTPTR